MPSLQGGRKSHNFVWDFFLLQERKIRQISAKKVSPLCRFSFLCFEPCLKEGLKGTDHSWWGLNSDWVNPDWVLVVVLVVLVVVLVVLAVVSS